MYVDDPPSLQHEFPYQAVGHPFVDVADVDGSFLVLLPKVYVNFFPFIILNVKERLTSAVRPTSWIREKGRWGELGVEEGVKARLKL